MNEVEMLEFAGFCSARWPGRPRTEQWALAWGPDFAPYTLEQAVEAARSWKSDGKVAPEGHDLIALLEGENEADAERMIGEIMEAIKSHGYYGGRPSDDYWSHPAIPRAIDAFGGWYALCMGHADLRTPATRAQMQRCLRAYAPITRPRPVLSDPMSNAIEASVLPALREMP